ERIKAGPRWSRLMNGAYEVSVTKIQGKAMTPRRMLLTGIPISLAASVVPPTAQAQSAPAAAESTIQSIVKRGRLLVGLSTFVPWAMRDKTGELIGFEVDVSK